MSVCIYYIYPDGVQLTFLCLTFTRYPPVKLELRIGDCRSCSGKGEHGA